MKKAVALCLIAAVVFACMDTLQADKKKYKKMPPGTFTLKSDGGIDFVLGVPRGYNPDRAGLPFMLCLHGDGIRDANDNKNVWSGWLSAATSAGFLVCAPKSPGQNWAGGARSLLGLVAELEEKYRLNIREYVVLGHSSGASVAYEVALKDSMRFSAFGSMGGRLQVNQEQVKKAGNLGAYIFHFSGDPIVASSFGKQAADQLKAAGATVEHKEQSMSSHAIEFYLSSASKVMIPWMQSWVKKKARVLTDPGDDRNLPWMTVLGFWEKLKSDKKAGLVYLYGEKDKDNKTAIWLRWEVFPDEQIKELAGEFICMKVDYSNDSYKDAIKELKVKKCALLVVDANKKVIKKWTKPASMSKLLKDLKKYKDKVEKSYK